MGAWTAHSGVWGLLFACERGACARRCACVSSGVSLRCDVCVRMDRGPGPLPFLRSRGRSSAGGCAEESRGTGRVASNNKSRARDPLSRVTPLPRERTTVSSARSHVEGFCNLSSAKSKFYQSARVATPRRVSGVVRRCAAPHAGPRPAPSLRTCDHRPMQYQTVRVGIP